MRPRHRILYAVSSIFSAMLGRLPARQSILEIPGMLFPWYGGRRNDQYGRNISGCNATPIDANENRLRRIGRRFENLDRKFRTDRTKTMCWTAFTAHVRRLNFSEAEARFYIVSNWRAAMHHRFRAHWDYVIPAGTPWLNDLLVKPTPIGAR